MGCAPSRKLPKEARRRARNIRINSNNFCHPDQASMFPSVAWFCSKAFSFRFVLVLCKYVCHCHCGKKKKVYCCFLSFPSLHPPPDLPLNSFFFSQKSVIDLFYLLILISPLPCATSMPCMELFWRNISGQDSHHHHLIFCTSVSYVMG